MEMHKLMLSTAHEASVNQLGQRCKRDAQVEIRQSRYVFPLGFDWLECFFLFCFLTHHLMVWLVKEPQTESTRFS